jgi:membrane protein
MDIKKAGRNIWRITKSTFQRFNENSCFTLSAALSYYTIFSIAPTLVIVITFVGYLFGKDAIEGEIYHQIKHLIGNDGAVAIQEFIQHTYEPHNTTIATVIGIVTLVFGATGVFNQLKFSLNTIWNVRPNPKIEFLKVVTDRVLSFAFILGIGFIMVVTLIINAILAVISDFVVSYFASFSVYILGIVNIVIALFILTLLFAAMFKVLPDAVTKWKDILIGGFLPQFFLFWEN